jgi:trigger factor
MRVDLSVDELGQEVEKRLRNLGRTARIPGFRVGKVPLGVLRRRYEAQVQREVLGEMIESSFSRVVQSEGLRPAGRPHIEPLIEPQIPAYGYTATFEVLPQVELGSLDAVSVKRPEVQITESDVDEMIERLRRQRCTWNPVSRATQMGDQVRVSYQGSVDGKPFEGGEGKGIPVELGSGMMIPGFEEGLLGACAGEERVLDLTIPASYRVESLAGKPASFRVTLETVSEPILPEVDEAFAHAFGVKDGDLARLREDVRNNMEREVKNRITSAVKNQVMDALLQHHPIEVPKVLVAEEIRSLKDRAYAGIPNSSQVELPDALFEEQARNRVGLGLIVGEIIRQQGLKVDAQRLRETVEDMAASYEDPKEVIDYYLSNREQRVSIESLVLENQVVDWVLGRVRVEVDPRSFQQMTGKSE